MLVVLNFCHRDQVLALQNAEWIASLTGSSEHKWIVAANQMAGRGDYPQRIADALRKKYAQVEILVHYDSDERQWPYAQNHAFQRCAQYVHGKYDEAWLWLECDAIPLGDGWLDTLAEEYHRMNKPFMGMLVDVTQSNGMPIPQHMSGVGIYPGHVAMHSIQAMTCTGLAFDMAGAEEVMPKAHFTNLIHHKYQCPSIDSDERYDSIVDKRAVLFHQQKDNQIIEYLKRRRSGSKDIVQMADEGRKRMVEATFQPLEFRATCDIFVKTFPRDYDWLRYCLRSIDKFTTGFRKIVVVAPDMAIPQSCRKMEWIGEADKEPGYLHQQVSKLYADEKSDADYILFMDSDCIFTRPVTPSNFIREGKVIWGHKEFRDDERRVWAPVLSKWMNEPATRSFMTGHPFVFPRWLFESLREYSRTMHKQELGDYVMGQADPKNMCSFSEFNCAGAWAYKYAKDKFTWENRDHEPPDGIWVHQGFTHGGEERKAQDLAEFERLLNDATPLSSPTLHLSQEYYDKALTKKLDQSVAVVQDVKYHVAALAEMAKANGLAKGRIALALKRAGLVKK